MPETTGDSKNPLTSIKSFFEELILESGPFWGTVQIVFCLLFVGIVTGVMGFAIVGLFLLLFPYSVLITIAIALSIRFIYRWALALTREPSDKN